MPYALGSLLQHADLDSGRTSAADKRKAKSCSRLKAACKNPSFGLLTRSAPSNGARHPVLQASAAVKPQLRSGESRESC